MMKSRNVSAGRLGAGLLVWAYALILAIPIYFLLVSSLKENVEIFANPFGLPENWLFSNYPQAWERAVMGRALVNSLLVTAAAEIITLALVVPASYGLARSKSRVSSALERIFALGFLIPAFATLVPVLLLSIALGLFQTREFLTLFMVATTLPLSIILLTQFMRSIPVELEESAMVDGLSRVRIMWHIYLPLSLPGIAMVVILNFLAYWNEFLFSLVLVGSNANNRTVQVALPTLIDQTKTEFGPLLAGTVITLIPVYLLYIALNRRLEGALTAGAIKG
jgi:multiple sugar transport system permease protein